MMGLSRLGVTTQTIRPDCTLVEASRLMMAVSVGALLITDQPKGPIKGIVTDRDIVRRIGEGASPATATVEAFTDRVVTTINEGATRAEVAQKLKMHGVRRLPVVDKQGELTGIISLDDILVELGQEISDLASTIRAEFQTEISKA